MRQGLERAREMGVDFCLFESTEVRVREFGVPHTRMVGVYHRYLGATIIPLMGAVGQAMVEMALRLDGVGPKT